MLQDLEISMVGKAITLDMDVCKSIIAQPSSGEAGEQLAVCIGLLRAMREALRDAVPMLDGARRDSAQSMLNMTACVVSISES